MFIRLVVLACVAAIAVACSSDAPTGPASGEVTGAVVTIDSPGLNQVTSFVIRSEGEEFEFFIDPDQDYGFPLGHLNEHRAGGDPVAVTYEEREGRLVALEIADS